MKKHEKEPCLDVLVQTFPDRTVDLEGPLGHVKMIPFEGSVSGPLFTGIVEPCGVDTQVTDPVGVRHMSARYMLTGIDRTGKSCHIYVENNGWFAEGSLPRPFLTVPTFRTDSEELSPILHSGEFIGEGQREEDGLHIRFYRLCPGEAE